MHEIRTHANAAAVKIFESLPDDLVLIASLEPHVRQRLLYLAEPADIEIILVKQTEYFARRSNLVRAGP